MEYMEVIRSWGLFALAIIGSIIALKNFSANNEQRKLENTFKVLAFLKEHITDQDKERFVELFQANNPLAGTPELFRFENGGEQSVADMFSEGGCGNGSIHNILEIFNLVSKELLAETIRVEMVWYEYGQIMSKCHEWVEKSFKGERHPWPDFMTFMASNPSQKYGALKFYTYAE